MTQAATMQPTTAVLRDDERIDRWGSIPFFLLHLAPFAAIATGARPVDWIVCLVLFYARMFGITAGLHRYFAHRSYKTSRPFAFLLAVLAESSAQKGVLWWAGHHRHHHRYSDEPEDIHSPVRRGFWWSHAGWMLCKRYVPTPTDAIKDFARYPELRWLDRHWLVPPVALGLATWLTLGWSGLLIGFCLSTVLCWHATFAINSVVHVWGSRRYATTDGSRNNWLLALFTMGEGWHNNHHYYQVSARQGFYWWELDASYLILRALSQIGVVWDLRVPTEKVLNANRVVPAAPQCRRRELGSLLPDGLPSPAFVREAATAVVATALVSPGTDAS